MELKNCSGCGVCSKVCPVGAIKMTLNQDGFYESVIDNDKCTGCNLCKKICPHINFDVSNSVEGSYSYVNENRNKLKKSSSGGISRKLIDTLSDDYNIVGVRYNYENNKAEHIICNNDKDFELLYGSKYIQSDFHSCLEKLDLNKKYLVFGTPCQIAGLDNYLKLKRKRENFVLIDFFCHGVPSYLLWDKYLSETLIKNIKKIEFRSKRFGWHKFTLHILGKTKEKYGELSSNDMFYRFFLSNVCLNKTCYNCPYKCQKSKADIRIGDMWGEKYRENTKGVSAVLTFTKKGSEILKGIENIKVEKIDDVVEGQIKKNIAVPFCRKKVLKKLRKKYKLEYIYYTDVFAYRILRKMRLVK